MPVAPPFGLAGPRKISGVGDGGGTRALTLYRPELQVCASYASLSDAPFKSWPAAERKSPKIVFCPQLGNGGPDRESADLEAAQTQLSAGMLFDPHLSSLHSRVSTTQRLKVGSGARFRKRAKKVLSQKRPLRGRFCTDRLETKLKTLSDASSIFLASMTSRYARPASTQMVSKRSYAIFIV